jgi:hypothetical protein
MVRRDPVREADNGALREPKLPPPVDPSKVTDDHRVKFHVAEFVALKNEVLEDVKTANKNFQYAATLSGGVVAWLLSTEGHTGVWPLALIVASFIPFLFTLLIGIDTLSIERRFSIKGAYLKRLEEEFGYGEGLGWEKYWHEHFRDIRSGTLKLWIALLLSDLVFAGIFTIFSIVRVTSASTWD